MSTSDTNVYPGRMVNTLTRKEVAARLGVTPRTVNRWMVRGTLAYRRNPLNGRPEFSLSDVQKLKSSRT